MALSKRTQVYLTPEQWRAVEEEARRRGTSAGEVVRRAIDQYCTPRLDFASAVRAAAGAWSHVDSVDATFVEALRLEWSERTRA